MAATDLYPLSSQRGEAIPLEMVRPASLTMFSFLAGAAGDITIPVGYKTCWLYATQDCILKLSATDLPAALISGTEYSRALFIPANTPLAVLLEAGEASLLGLAAAGNLYINSITQWAALSQALQSELG
jgi:hypothetical protein